MEVRYKKDPDGAYMVLQGETECEEYAERMLSENRISGVMPLTVREIDGKKEYCFDISAGRAMSGVLERRPMTMNEMSGLIASLSRTVDHMDEYLMNINHLVIDPGMICLPMESHRGPGGYERMEPDFSRAVFCCHPAYEKDFLEQVRALICFFLNKADHMETSSMDSAYELFQISQKEYFRLEELEEVCREWEHSSESYPYGANDDSDAEFCTATQNSEEPLRLSDCEIRTTGKKERETRTAGKTSQSGSFLKWIPIAAGIVLTGWNLYQYMFCEVIQSEWISAGLLLVAAGIAIPLADAVRRDFTDNCDSEKNKDRSVQNRGSQEEENGKILQDSYDRQERYEETVPVRENHGELRQRRSPVLVSENLLVQDNIYIRKLPFTLGKKDAMSDGILDSPTVSRRHARISCRSGEYYLEDCGSTNGTFLNGSPLEPQQSYPLQPGDEVALAERKFIFQYA